MCGQNLTNFFSAFMPQVLRGIDSRLSLPLLSVVSSVWYHKFVIYDVLVRIPMCLITQAVLRFLAYAIITCNLQSFKRTLRKKSRIIQCSKQQCTTILQQSYVKIIIRRVYLECHTNKHVTFTLPKRIFNIILRPREIY